MQPISIQTTSKKIIVSIDKQWIDVETFARFIEKLKLKILSRDTNLDETLEHWTPQDVHQTPRYIIAQRFKSSAKSAFVTSKYDVYEQ